MSRVGDRDMASVRSISPKRRAHRRRDGLAEEEPDMRALARAGALDRGLDGELLAGFADRGDVFAPRMPVEIDCQQAARVVGEQRIDAHDVMAFEVGSQLVFRRRCERLVRALPALHPAASRTPPASTRWRSRAPIRCDPWRSPSAWERHLADPRNRRSKSWSLRSGGQLSLDVAALAASSSPDRPLGGAQLIQATAGIVAAASELVEPSFLSEDLRGKIAIGVHAASFCKADRRQERPLRSLKDVDG